MARTTSLADRLRGGHLLRIEPQPHAVIALADVGDVAHAFQPRKFVFELDRGVVAQIQIVAAAVGREQIDDHQHAGRFLFHRHAAALHQVGQNRLGQRHAVLHQHLGHVQIDAVLERHRQHVVAVVGALGRHVQHVFDADHLLLDRRGDGIGHHLGIGAGIRRRNFDRRRRDFRILRNRQRRTAPRPPASVMMIDSTEAKIGRLMKNAENIRALIFQRRFARHCRL